MGKYRRSETEHDIDKIIGKRIKVARLMMEMNQKELGERIGVTLQQIQKYERGANRVTCSRIMSIAHALGKNVSYFYDSSWGPSVQQESSFINDMKGIFNTDEEALILSMNIGSLAYTNLENFRQKLIRMQIVLNNAVEKVTNLRIHRMQEELVNKGEKND